MNGSDHDLIRRMLGGGEEAFVELYERHQRPLFRFGLHMTGSVAMAEDVTQDVFLALMVDGQRFDAARGKLRSFLFGIARNQILRRLDQDRGLESEPEDFDAPGDADALEDLTRRETIENVRRAIVSLPRVYREAVVLCELEECSYEEAAQILECPVGTVRSRISRGREILARKLESVSQARSVR